MFWNQELQLTINNYSFFTSSITRQPILFHLIARNRKYHLMSNQYLLENLLSSVKWSFVINETSIDRPLEYFCKSSFIMIHSWIGYTWVSYFDSYFMMDYLYTKHSLKFNICGSNTQVIDFYCLYKNILHHTISSIIDYLLNVMMSIASKISVVHQVKWFEFSIYLTK